MLAHLELVYPTLLGAPCLWRDSEENYPSSNSWPFYTVFITIKRSR